MPDAFLPGTVLLDASPHGARDARSFAFARPRCLLVARAPGDVAAVLAAAEAETRAGRYVAGLVTYEAGAAMLGVPHATPVGVPYVWLGVYDAPSGPPPLPEGDVRIGNVRAAWSEAEYAARHARVQALIREGDVYQVNLTFPVAFDTNASGAALYAALRARQPVPYGALLVLDEATAVASVSPELFFRLDGGAGGERHLTTRPMKGTRPRGNTPAADDALRADLTASDKERAENLIIVDLLRNDLARVCVPGSVAVPHLFETEAHPTLHQMTSTVTGRLRPDAGVAEVFAALFPSGSITGAPKHRAMVRIQELEPWARGAYCGAIGVMGPDVAAFSVAIRTATLHGAPGTHRRGTLGVGSGVVWASDAGAEYRECLLKARFLTDLADR